MLNKSNIQLQLSSILNVPFQVYTEDFTFIVNGEEFKTTKIFSDLISPKISRIHSTDPTFDTFVINTKQKGNFSHIINLINFSQNDLPSKEIPFIKEIIEILGNDSIQLLNSSETVSITLENIFDLIIQHEKQNEFNSKRFSDEIDFLSQHFYELCESNKDDFKQLQRETLERVVNHSNFQIEDEDQFLTFCNNLYHENPSYAWLYDYVYFRNATSSAMKEFVSIYDINDITGSVWNHITNRLKQEVTKSDTFKSNRYKNQTMNQKKSQFFDNKNDQELNGIIKYLMDISEDEIVFTSSSVIDTDESHQPSNVALFNDRTRRFESNDSNGNWLCLDFKKHRVTPTKYTLRSALHGPGWRHPRSWVFEGSNDKNEWEVVDAQTECPLLNGSSLVHTFDVQKNQGKEFRYIRIRSTGKDWRRAHYLVIDSFEIYGTLL